jgi:hypothetical protein
MNLFIFPVFDLLLFSLELPYILILIHLTGKVRHLEFIPVVFVIFSFDLFLYLIHVLLNYLFSLFSGESDHLNLVISLLLSLFEVELAELCLLSLVLELLLLVFLLVLVVSSKGHGVPHSQLFVGEQAVDLAEAVGKSRSH